MCECLVPYRISIRISTGIAHYNLTKILLVQSNYFRIISLHQHYLLNPLKSLAMNEHENIRILLKRHNCTAKLY